MSRLLVLLFVGMAVAAIPGLSCRDRRVAEAARSAAQGGGRLAEPRGTVLAARRRQSLRQGSGK